MIGLDRRHLLATLGAGLMTTRPVSAESPPQDIAHRLAQVQQDRKVDGLHTLLVSQGRRLMIEHYGRGDDETWGRPLGVVRVFRGKSATDSGIKSATDSDLISAIPI